jgi:hypothetical protein
MNAVSLRSLNSWIARMTIAAALLAACAAAAAEHSLPAPVRQEGFAARQVGGGLLTWFGFEIYEASLWTTDGEFSGVGKLQQPTALSLWYRRGFSREKLIEITQNGWTEFKLATPQQQERWSAQLERIWVDTTKGANMTALVLPGGETRFYNAQRYLGSVSDAAFGPAFLGIWLDAQTRGTRLEHLRTALLGRSHAASSHPASSHPAPSHPASCKNSAQRDTCSQDP